MPELPSDPRPHTLSLLASQWIDYELIDSGNGQKLERYGPYTFNRPEPQAIWNPALNEQRWRSAHATFRPSREESGGHWEFTRPVAESWTMHYKNITFLVQTTAGRHLGVFPEQAVHWDWVSEKIRLSSHPVKVLNLFGYTGLASLSAALAGAAVTHIDASKKALGWGKQNQALSGLEDRPIRWLLDDSIKFVQREARRGVQYDGILLDPPKFGRGPKGEVWEFFEQFPQLMGACRAVLSPHPLFIVVTAYAIRASALSLYFGLQDTMEEYKGEIECGELVLEEGSANRIISSAIYARWSAI